VDTIHFIRFFLQILGILLHINLGGFSVHVWGFSVHVYWSKRAVQMFARNTGWQQIAVGGLWMHSTAQSNQDSKTEFIKKISEGKFTRIVPLFRANLILRPASRSPYPDIVMGSPRHENSLDQESKIWGITFGFRKTLHFPENHIFLRNWQYVYMYIYIGLYRYIHVCVYIYVYMYMYIIM